MGIHTQRCVEGVPSRHDVPKILHGTDIRLTPDQDHWQFLMQACHRAVVGPLHRLWPTTSPVCRRCLLDSAPVTRIADSVSTVTCKE
mmetsp:Transcript_8063/g.17435  ORF Transcript_8063/g.17435 Transcript_8063/m.17435 type:complete len:87 (-) Transcript_8063:1522-1782(-)